MRSKIDPCQNCRKHHVKCDNAKPKCGRCRRLKKDCVRAGQQLKFLHSTSGHLSTGSTEPAGRSVLAYIDETPALAKLYGRHNAPVDVPVPAETLEEELITPEHAEERLLPLVPWNTGAISQSPETHLWVSPSSHTENASNLGAGFACGVSSSASPPLLSERCVLQRQLDLEESCLLRYFVEDLAKWFDLCDPERHFAVAVPQRARACPPLLDAILSVSARHFSTLSREKQRGITLTYGLQQRIVISEETMLYYHSRCITHLRSVSEEPDAIMDENLLAAIVILRFYEELDSPFMVDPNETAVRGLQMFIETQAASALASPGFRQAVFWVGFRQEFHLAFSKQRPFRHPLAICEGYRPWNGAPDHVWVNRLLVISAKIVQYCFDDKYQQSYTSYDELVAHRTRWLDRCPSSFSPVYFRQADRHQGELFPTMWYLDDCHIVAVQSIGLINILLTAYNPRIPRVGIGEKQAMASIDAEIRSTVLEICGVALSNRQSPTALLTACMAIAMCGERFTDRSEQEALMRIVVDMSHEHNYWPTSTMQTRLREVWNWD